MMLEFKEQFVKPIMLGTKIHTIRKDEANKWQAGDCIEMATDVGTKYFKWFNQNTGIGEKVISTQTIQIYIINDFLTVRIDGKFYAHCNVVNPHLDNIEMDLESHKKFAKDYDKIIKLSLNSGFDKIQDFFNWFDKPFTGKIIHWTNYKY